MIDNQMRGKLKKAWQIFVIYYQYLTGFQWAVGLRLATPCFVAAQAAPVLAYRHFFGAATPATPKKTSQPKQDYLFCVAVDALFTGLSGELLSSNRDVYWVCVKPSIDAGYS